MRKTIKFGKIDYNGHGRKNCAVEVEIELRDTDKGPELSICGNIWNPRHTDIYCGGQCLDTIAEYVHTPLFKELYRFWQLYHLNGMKPGTRAQERAVKEYLESHNERYDYTKICEYLKSIGLYEDNGYRYGSAWLYEEIPDLDLARIREIIQNV